MPSAWVPRGPLAGAASAALAGVGLALAFPDAGLFPLAWVSLVPYLLFLLGAPSWRSTLLGHALFSLAYFGVLLYWIPQVLVVYGSISWWVAVPLGLALVAMMGILLAPFTLLLRWSAARSPALALLAAPGLWVLTELLRTQAPFGGFPWGLLGYSQVADPLLVQTADIGGVYLVSFLLVSANSALASALGRAWKISLGLAGLVLVAHLYGAYRLYLWRPAPEAPLVVSLVQPCIRLDAEREHYAERYFEYLAREYQMAVESGSEWVIFPEAPNPFLFGDDFYFTSFWEREVRDHPATLIFNSVLREGENPPRYFNGAIALGPSGEMFRYRKTRLVPFGEYVPGRRWLGKWLEPLVREVGAFSAGSDLPVGRLGKVEVGILICYEAIFPALSRHYALEGAGVLVNLTDDSWYGRSAAPAQHLQAATFRAVEMRRPLLRSANSGISAVIDPWGRVRGSLGLFEDGALEADISPVYFQTLYATIGDWSNIVLSALALLLVLASPLAGGSGARHSRSGSRRASRQP